MTDKQIIINGVDVSLCKHYKHNDKNSGWSSCTSKDEEHIHVVNPLCCEKKDCYYKQLTRAKEENEKLKNQIKNEKQALQIDIDNLNQVCLDLNQENDDLLNKLQAKEQECEALQISDNEAVEIIAELKAYKDVNEDFKTAWEELKAENDELKKIVNEAKNSKLDLKSFLVGEAVQNEYEQKLDQLKAENEELKKNLNEGCLQHLTLMTEQQVLLKTLAEIKEIAERRNYLDYNECLDDILQKISECEVKNDNK